MVGANVALDNALKGPRRPWTWDRRGRSLRGFTLGDWQERRRSSFRGKDQPGNVTITGPAEGNVDFGANRTKSALRPRGLRSVGTLCRAKRVSKDLIRFAKTSPKAGRDRFSPAVAGPAGLPCECRIESEPRVSAIMMTIRL